jgi:hypothetical protein
MSQLCQFKEHIDVTAQEHTPQGIQDLLDELEASKQARLRAWAVQATWSISTYCKSIGWYFVATGPGNE